MRKLSLNILIILLFTSACGVLYTEEQVNETVVAKIKEVAGMQKVNVTVETVIVEKVIVVTATPEPSATAWPILPTTMTPIGFERIQPDQVIAALTNAGFEVRRFYYEPDSDKIGSISQWTSTITEITLEDGAQQFSGFIYSFPSQENADLGFTYLTSQKSGVSNQSVFQKSNLLIELEADTPVSVLDRVRNGLAEIR